MKEKQRMSNPRSTPEKEASTVDDGVMGPVSPALKEVNDKIERARKAGWHIVGPGHFSSIPGAFKVVLSKVVLGDSDYYEAQRGTYSINLRGLRKIGDAMGIRWISSERLDNGKDEMLAEVKVTAMVQGFDGLPRTMVGSKTIDIRALDMQARRQKSAKGDKSEEQIEYLIEGDRIELLKHRVGRAESGAQGRVIVALSGIKQGGYALTDFQKPFLVPSLVIDDSDPVVKRALLDAAIGFSAALYGTRQTLPPARRLQPVESMPELPAHDEDGVVEEAPPLAEEVAEFAAPEVAEESPGNGDDSHVSASTVDEFKKLDDAKQVALLQRMAAEKKFPLGKLSTPIEKMAVAGRIGFFAHLTK